MSLDPDADDVMGWMIETTGVSRMPLFLPKECLKNASVDWLD